MRKKIQLLMMAALMASSIHAAEVTASQALSTAQQFVNQGTAKFRLGKSATLKLAYEGRSTDGKPDYYVFNRGTDGGFVVVSGEDRVQPVWGYCDRGTFDYNKMPENVKAWFSEYQRQMQFLREHPDVEARARVTLSSGVGPLMTTQWDQTRPFNDMCPEAPSANDKYLIYGGRACTGCASAAMAQIMKYHKWPKKGTGSYSYECTVKYYDPESGELVNDVRTLSADLTQSVYQWNLMKDQYLYKDMNNYGYFDENMHIYIKIIDENGDTVPDIDNIHGNAVAKLISDIGVTLKMQYASCDFGSGAFISNVYNAFRDYFDYTVNYYDRNSWFSNWDDLLRNELNSGRPIYYAGKGSGSHAFVIDGYDTEGRFHINWGWGGDYDGYFETLALTPGNHNYNTEQRVVFCRPNKPTTPMLTASVADGETIDFGFVEKDASLSRAITVYGENLTNNVTVSITGADASQFQTVATLPVGQVMSSQGCTFDVSYCPTALGQHHAQLVISAGYGTEPITVSLSGMSGLYYDVDQNGVVSIADAADLIDLILVNGYLYYTGAPAAISDVTDLIDYLLEN